MAREHGPENGPQAADHPLPEELRRLVRGPVGDREEAARRHLEAGCPACALRLRDLWAAESGRLARLVGRAVGDEEPDPAEVYPGIVVRARAHATLLRAEHSAAAGLAAELLALPPAAREPTVRSESRFRLLGLAQRLAERSRREVFEDPGRALELGRLAVAVAESLDGLGYETPFVADSLADAWGAVANAHRVATAHPEAERAFRAAFGHLSRGTRRVRVEHDLWSLLASLRIDQARFPEAVRILSRSAAAYREEGQERLEGRVLVKLAKAAVEAGRPEEGVEIFEAAEDLLEPAEDGELVLYTLHARVAALLEAGQTGAAAELFAEIRPVLERRLRGFANRQRLAWLKGLVAAAEGRFGAAERTLDRVRRRFEERDEAYLSARVALDLAALYLERGRTGDVRRLAGEMMPVFTSHRIHHHALAALALFQRAAVAETATAELVREISAYLRRARNNPYLRFRPAG